MFKIPRKSIHELMCEWMELINNSTVSCHKCGKVTERENVKDFRKEFLKNSRNLILCSSCVDELLEEHSENLYSTSKEKRDGRRL